MLLASQAGPKELDQKPGAGFRSVFRGEFQLCNLPSVQKDRFLREGCTARTDSRPGHFHFSLGQICPARNEPVNPLECAPALPAVRIIPSCLSYTVEEGDAARMRAASIQNSFAYWKNRRLRGPQKGSLHPAANRAARPLLDGSHQSREQQTRRADFSATVRLGNPGSPKRPSGRSGHAGGHRRMVAVRTKNQTFDYRDPSRSARTGSRAFGAYPPGKPGAHLLSRQSVQAPGHPHAARWASPPCKALRT